MSRETLRNTKATLTTETFSDPTPLAAEDQDPERFRLYRLCACGECGGTGKLDREQLQAYSDRIGKEIKRELPSGATVRCEECRGEGRALDLVATCATPEAVGVALVTLGREGEWKECPVGVLDTLGAKNQKWILSPWLPSPRNISDAARTLAHAPRKNPVPQQ